MASSKESELLPHNQK